MKKLTGEESVMSNFFSDGLTIRQYYAGLAMQSLIGQYEGKSPDRFLFDINSLIPQVALIYADALITEFNKDATIE